MQLSILKKEDLSESFHHFFACGIAMSEREDIVTTGGKSSVARRIVVSNRI